MPRLARINVSFAVLAALTLCAADEVYRSAVVDDKGQFHFSRWPHRRILLCVYGRYILGGVAERNDALDGCSGFEWDESNTHKNWERHRVSPEEAEDVFFNEPLVVRSDIGHSRREKRYYALGQTGNGRCLFVAFTIRRCLVRVISVRDMNRRERDAYAKHENEAGA